MTAFILRRLLQMIPILFGITLLTFVIVNAAGDPLQQLELNPRVTAENLEQMRESLGLNEPVLVRYFVWLGNVLQGDFSLSMIYFRPVLGMILDVLPFTMFLSVTSIVLSLLIAFPLAIYSALHRNGIVDRVSTTLAVAGYAVPTVWLALLLILFFSAQFREWGLPYLPTSGDQSFRGEGAGSLADRAKHTILPLTALTIPQIASWTRYIRSSMLEVISQDYVRTAAAKGLRARSITYVHALRNALLPLITLAGLSLPEVFAGSLIVENVFAYAGMGRLFVESAQDSDYTLVMGLTLMFAVLIILGNLIADVLYAVTDPRIRYD